MITYNMCVNGACVRTENKEIIWKKTKGRRKIGIIISKKSDSYQYNYDFKDHCIERELFWISKANLFPLEIENSPETKNS